MARSSLLDLLPDFSEHRPAQRQPTPPGFEPLVHAAFSKEEFTALGMPIGFTGVAPDPEPVLDADPFADLSGAHTDPLGDLDDLAPAGDDLGLPDLDGELADSAAELDAPGPELDLSSELALEPGAGLPGIDASDDIDIAAADAIAAQDAIEEAHREEIERLQEAHREAMNALLNEAIPNAKREIAEALAADLAPLLAGRIRADFVETTLQALSRKVAEVLEDASAVSFDLRGPEHLISAFLETWTGDAAQIRPIPDDGVDLLARIDRNVIATRLSDFDRLIEEATA